MPRVPDPIAFKLFFIQVSWNSVFIILALFLMLYLTLRNAKRTRIKAETVYSFGIFALIFGFLFARLFYRLFNPAIFADYTISHKLTDGGYSLFGAMFGVLLSGVVYFSVKRKLPSFLNMLDAMAPGAALAIALGRWGNFFNQESFGPAISNEAFMKFPFAVYIETLEEWRLALFFYESVLCVLIYFAVLSVRRKYLRPGAAAVHFFIYYSTARAVIESLRKDSMYLGFVRISQVFAAIVILAIFLYYIIGLFKKVGFKVSYLAGCIFFLLALTVGFLSQFFIGADNFISNTLLLAGAMLAMMCCTTFVYREMYNTKFMHRKKDIFSNKQKMKKSDYY